MPTNILSKIQINGGAPGPIADASQLYGGMHVVADATALSNLLSNKAYLL